MITINEITFTIIVQTIIILLLISAFLLFLLRQKNKQLKSRLDEDVKESTVSDTASTEHYISTEIKLTEARFNSLYTDEDRNVVELIEPDWLMLRKHYLEMEKELLETKDREDAFWMEVGKALKQVIKNSYLFKSIKMKETEDSQDGIGVEDVDLMKLIKDQDDKFDSLLLELEEGEDKVEISSLKEKLVKISASHKELTFCVFMLEDENKFLRDQIKGLLEMQ